MHTQLAICPDKKQVHLLSSLPYSETDSQVNNLRLYLAVSVLQMPAVTSRSRPWLPQPCQICLHTRRVEQRIRLFPWKDPYCQYWAPTSPILITRETGSPAPPQQGPVYWALCLHGEWLVPYRLTLQHKERKEDGRMECWKGKGNALS